MDMAGAVDIISLSRVSQHLHDLSEDYWRSALNIKRQLQAYFPTEGGPDDFLDLMKETGAIISGSTALQFFARRVFQDADLDVYIPSPMCEKAHRWLAEFGYECRTTKREKNGDGLDDVYPTIKEIEKVDSFKLPTRGKVIQVIATKHLPLSAVLDFHSSESHGLLSKALLTDRPDSMRDECHHPILRLCFLSTPDRV